MSKALGKRCVWGLCGVLASALIVSSAAQAEVSTDLSGTVVVYPKVIYDGTRDTVIQLANTPRSGAGPTLWNANIRSRIASG